MEGLWDGQGPGEPRPPPTRSARTSPHFAPGEQEPGPSLRRPESVSGVRRASWGEGLLGRRPTTAAVWCSCPRPAIPTWAFTTHPGAYAPITPNCRRNPTPRPASHRPTRRAPLCRELPTCPPAVSSQLSPGALSLAAWPAAPPAVVADLSRSVLSPDALPRCPTGGEPLNPPGVQARRDRAPDPGPRRNPRRGSPPGHHSPGPPAPFTRPAEARHWQRSGRPEIPPAQS